jgi:hypothetical protein
MCHSISVPMNITHPLSPFYMMEDKSARGNTDKHTHTHILYPARMEAQEVGSDFFNP